MDQLEKKLNGIAAGIHKTVTIVLIPLMALIIALDVVLRYFFNAPLSWSHEVNGLLLLLVFLGSLIYCWDQGKHVRMEIFYNRFSSKFKMMSDLASALTGIIFFGLLGVQCFFDIPYMIQTNEIGQETGVWFWPFKIVMAFICCLFFLKLTLNIITIFRKRN